MSAAAPLALSFESVSKRYKRSHLGKVSVSLGLDSMSLSVEPGMTFGLLGLNGAGKTTTMKLALGLIEPSEGTVGVFGEKPGSREALSKVGYLPELPYMYRWLSAREALRFYGRLSGLSAAGFEHRIAEVLDAVGLAAAADKKSKEYSKGMLQRLGLAQAILHRPKLLLLDEPVSGLDPLAIKDMRSLLQRLKADSVAMVISSHSISEVEALCDAAAILSGGRLVRLVKNEEWQSAPGRLEDIFVETVRPAGNAA